MLVLEAAIITVDIAPVCKVYLNGHGINCFIIFICKQPVRVVVYFISCNKLLYDNSLNGSRAALLPPHLY